MDYLGFTVGGSWLIWAIIGVAAWIALGLPSGLIAERRGRGGIRWFILGLLLGPVASLMVLILPRRARPAGGAGEPVRPVEPPRVLPAQEPIAETAKEIPCQAPIPEAAPPQEPSAPEVLRAIPTEPEGGEHLEPEPIPMPAAAPIELPEQPPATPPREGVPEGAQEPPSEAPAPAPPAPSETLEAPTPPAEGKNPFYFFDGYSARDVAELYRELSARQDYWGYVRSGDVENWLRYLGEDWVASLAAGYREAPAEFVKLLGEYLEQRGQPKP